MQKSADAEARAKIILAEMKADAIKRVADARQEEAQYLNSVPIAQDLERIRVTGDAGERVFQGEKNNFVFGQNPGDMIFSMLKGLKKWFLQMLYYTTQIFFKKESRGPRRQKEDGEVILANYEGKVGSDFDRKGHWDSKGSEDPL